MTRFRDAVKAVESRPSTSTARAGTAARVQDDMRFTTARQANLGGTGIGSFSDRIRDPIRGGGPFDSGASHVQNQGFVSGWYYDSELVELRQHRRARRAAQGVRQHPRLAGRRPRRAIG